MKEMNMKTEQMFIKVPNDLWKDRRLSDLDFVVYCMIQRNLTMRAYSPITVSAIYEMLKFSNKNYCKSIKESLVRLSDLNLIGCYDIMFNALSNKDIMDMKSVTMINISSIMLDESFFVITESAIMKIIELSKQVKNRMCFFRYFASICRIINNNNYKCKKA